MPAPLSLETLRKRSMLLTDLVAPNAIIPALKVNSKKQVLQELAAKATELCGQSERTILEILQQREKLGSTGVGNGIAIPHGKLPKLSKLFGLFARLERPVEFEALDGEPVDLVFLLLAPEAAGADHLKGLARVARLLRDADVARKLRDSRDAEALYAVLAMPSASAAWWRFGGAGVGGLLQRSFRATGSRAAAFRVAANRGSMQADGCDLALRRIRHDRFAALGEHDRRAVGRVQHEHAVTGWEQRRLRAQERDLLRADCLDVGHTILAQGRESFGGHRRAGHCGRIEHDTCSSRLCRAWMPYRSIRPL